MVTDFSAERHHLIEFLRREIRDQRVLGAMGRVPREMFVGSSQWPSAYDDRPLPIGHGQTISQPLMVAMMTEALDLEGPETVLEVGTGSGYQAAILAELARRVITVERIADLVRKAEETLGRLGYHNIEVHVAGPTLGWPGQAPYDAIVVSAGAPRVPDVLLDQMAVGGRLVIPVGSRYEQNLIRVLKRERDTIMEEFGPCRWVPLIGEGAWSEQDAAG